MIILDYVRSSSVAARAVTILRSSVVSFFVMLTSSCPQTDSLESSFENVWFDPSRQMARRLPRPSSHSGVVCQESIFFSEREKADVMGEGSDAEELINAFVVQCVNDLNGLCAAMHSWITIARHCTSRRSAFIVMFKSFTFPNGLSSSHSRIHALSTERRVRPCTRPVSFMS